MSKKIISLLLAFVTIFIMIGCDKKEIKYGEIGITEESQNDNPSEEICIHNWNDVCGESLYCLDCGATAGYKVEHYFTEATYDAPKTCTKCGATEGEKLKLSSSCDKVLASGYDKDNNFYELVANEHEDYSGTTVEMGVIKNNNWSVPLTKNTPFFGENGYLRAYENENIDEAKSIYYKYSRFLYVGAGCFYYEDCLWNVNNGKVYTEPDYSCWEFSCNGTICINNDGEVLLRNYKEETLKMFDTDTMTIGNTIGIGIDYNNEIYPYSEGLFARINDRDKEVQGFYDCKGNKVIDLSMYDIIVSETVLGVEIPYSDMFFKDGKCTFRIINDQNNHYDITIDKTGKVIDSVARER